MTDKLIQVKKIKIFFITLAALACIGSRCPFEPGGKNSIDIAYTITGGFAGILEETHIDENGYGELQTRQNIKKRYQLSNEELNHIYMAFETADFFRLKREYKPLQPIADGFFYSITYTKNTHSKTIHTETEAVMPARLQYLIETLHDTNLLIETKGTKVPP
ncbi:MAG: protealysin inhibitor emfourin [bacterium]